MSAYVSAILPLVVTLEVCTVWEDLLEEGLEQKREKAGLWQHVVQMHLMLCLMKPDSVHQRSMVEGI